MTVDQFLTNPAFYGTGLGVGLPLLYLFIKGYIWGHTAVKHVIDEGKRKDQMIEEKDTYIKQLVSEQGAQNEILRKEIVPALFQLLKEIHNGN